MMKNRATKIGFWALLILFSGGVTASNLYRRHLRSSFERAILSDDASAVESLLKQGVSPNEPVKQTPPLFQTLARYQRQDNPMSPISRRYPACEDIALLLIKQGAKLEELNGMRETPLFAALQADAMRVVRELLNRHVDLNIRNANQQTALHIACQSGSREAVQRLVESGADVNAIDASGSTPLFIAAQGARTKTARLLVEHGAKINLVDKSGISPLYYAIASGSDPKNRVFAAEMAKYLLSKGANPQIRGKNGQSVATLATSEEMAKVLESLGVPFPAPGSKDERTILGYAINNADVEMALKCRASIPKMEDAGYVAALQMAQQRKSQTLLNLLNPLMNAKRFRLYLKNSLMNGAPSLASHIPPMIRESKYTLTESDWQELLSWAIAGKNQDSVEAILEKGVSVNYVDKSGRTPAMEAVLSENPPLLKAILARRPDLTRKTRGGLSALDFANRAKKPDIIHLLEAAGAKN